MTHPRATWTTLRLVAAGTALLLAMAPICTRGDDTPKNPRDLKLFRFEFDNDSFVGSDDSFSAGWSFQFHSRLMDQWGGGLDR